MQVADISSSLREGVDEATSMHGKEFLIKAHQDCALVEQQEL